jgi:hypothetical protein
VVACQKKARYKARAAWVGVIIAIFLIGFVVGAKDIDFQSPIGAASPAEPEEATVSQPFEFLYLDISRVGSYLAQLKGGTYVKQRLTEKVVNKASGEVTFQSVLKAGASSENEDFVEREVTPTAASSFLELVKELKGAIEKGYVHNFRGHAESVSLAGNVTGNSKVEEGEFIRFRAKLHAPSYFAPYLEVHHAATLAALFPSRGREKAKREFAKRQRDAARKFEKQVGRNPRFLLTIKPEQNGQSERSVTFLMPVRLRQLNEERSLLLSGGAFTVVGKVTRLFMPWPTGDETTTHTKHASYIDSLTRELWTQPLVTAPKGLICRASPACARAIEESDLRGYARRVRAERVHSEIEGTRRHMLGALRRETKIKHAGAVILPIAIYR